MELSGRRYNINMTDDKKVDVGSYHPLVLAYMGDAVYEVHVRDMLIQKRKVSVHKLHVESILYVKASAQASVLRDIIDDLTEEELNIVRRGRNAKSGTIPKNAKVSDYKYATAFEALIGYLYLSKMHERLDFIIEKAILSVDKKRTEGVDNSER